MSIAKVKIISIIGLEEKLDEVINFCGKTEAFEPDDALSFYSNTEKFTSLSKQDPYQEGLQNLKSLANKIKKPLEIIDTREFDITPFEAEKYVLDVEKKFDSLIKNRNLTNLKINEYKNQIVQLKHFEGLDVNLSKLFSCQYISTNFGRIPVETYHKLKEYKENPYVMFFTYKQDATHFWGMYCVPNDHKEEVDKIFASLYFERMELLDTDETPINLAKQLNEKTQKKQEELKEIESEIDSLWEKEKLDFIKIYSKLTEYSTYYKIRNYGAHYNGKFIIAGWIPKKKQKEFISGLNEISGIEYDISNANEAPKHIPPTLVKNNFFTKPYSFFVNMYGTPNYKELDPTPFVSLTYFILFGIMFGDVGHGFVLLLIGIILALKKNALGKILIPCSFTSMLFGFVFGSVFGFEHALNPVYKALFNLNDKPISVMESSTTNYILYCSAGIGVVLVICAIGLNIIASIKRGNIGKGLFSPNGVAGLVFYVSIIFGAVLQLTQNMPVFSNKLFLLFLIILPLIFMMFSELLSDIISKRRFVKPEDGFGGYIVQSFFELFESVLSYLTNTVSFLRIGAYVLVHAGMLLVVSTLAQMFAPWSIGYTVIIVFGNIFVIGLEALLVGIQVLRLEFYEMFSRFYDGDGHKFSPISVKRSLKRVVT